MRIKTIVVVAAIAMAATIGSAYAAEQFATLDGIVADPMTASQMEGARAGDDVIFVSQKPNLSGLPVTGGGDIQFDPGSFNSPDAIIPITIQIIVDHLGHLIDDRIDISVRTKFNRIILVKVPPFQN